MSRWLSFGRQHLVTIHSKENHSMKKLLVFALGLGIALGTVSFSFAQDTTDTTKKMSKKKTKKKTTDTTSTTK
jgi:hypothetical protein